MQRLNAVLHCLTFNTLCQVFVYYIIISFPPAGLAIKEKGPGGVHLFASILTGPPTNDAKVSLFFFFFSPQDSYLPVA